VRCGVLGDPIAHSLSPALHRAAYAACGLDWEYDAHRVQAGGLGDFVDRLGPEWRGLSVTAPLKREAVERADVASAAVTMAGAANTLVRDGGRWHADNTDIPGAAAALRERWTPEISAATVLGGGATAASAGLALAGLGAASIRLMVRDPSRAAEAAAAIGRHPATPGVEVVSLHDGEVVGDVVVSTIPATAQTPELVDRCGGPPVVFEIVYHPWPTPLAESVLRGRTDRVLVTGLDLLVHQAALQFERFTGHPAPLDAMRSALP
jgi:shikimate dehydrogenase